VDDGGMAQIITLTQASPSDSLAIDKGKVVAYKLTGTWDGASVAITDEDGYAYETLTENGGNTLDPAMSDYLFFNTTGAGASTNIKVEAVHREKEIN
jgi:hypothetical protein